MGKWIGTNGNTVTILPFTDKGYKFITLDCEEIIGGKFANGKIEMVHDGNPEAVKLITDQETVDIELGTTDLGTVLVIHGVIMHLLDLLVSVNYKYHYSSISDLSTS